jgi:16S rRNA (cytidine(1402)-2'-O)-methyltransferase
MTDARPGQLLVVGTPIGNLDDFSPRGRRALAEATAIFCEDTRVTAKLAARFGITARRISCPGPREESRVAELLERLRAGETVAITTDAGMPTLSDPGVRLVEAAVTAGFPVRVVPGPSAPAAALAVSGLPPVPHVFLGFLPARVPAVAVLERSASGPETPIHPRRCTAWSSRSRPAPRRPARSARATSARGDAARDAPCSPAFLRSE